jgi:hypothetical protein
MLLDSTQVDPLWPADDGRNADRLPPPAIARALHAFAMHEAARARHAAILGRYREAIATNRELRDTAERLREHSAAAMGELRSLRSAVCEYAHELRQAKVPPQRALLLVRSGVRDMIAAVPPGDALSDPRAIADQIVQWVTAAYYEAA